MLRKQCQRLADHVRKGRPLDTYEYCPTLRATNTHNRPQVRRQSLACSGCPLFLASKGPCALYSTCPIYQQQEFFSSASPSSNPPRKCYCCFEQLDAIMPIQCPSCRRIQSRQHLGLNHFQLLQDGRVSFEIDKRRLRQRYLDFQRILHPDQFTGHAEETAKAVDWSVHLNIAYETLKSDLKRAIYLYNLIAPCEYEEETCGSSLSQEELLEILEIRERIEGSTTKDESAAILGETQIEIQLIKSQLTEAFNKDDFETQRHLIDRLKFMHSILEAAETCHEAPE